jgi:hypothetical protein
MKKAFALLALGVMFASITLAQGPPITSDKPIMLGAKRTIIKTLTEVRKGKQGTVITAPLMLHYLPTANTLLILHVPYVFSKVNGETKNGLTDISVTGKYQFYRKDKTAKTLRAVLKYRHTFPMGERINVMGIGLKSHQSYIGGVLGYESIKYGISNELAYNAVWIDNTDELVYKLGIGLPLLKSTYPVNQINLYFEYNANWQINLDRYNLLYAQGIQYARGRFTFETAIQVPLAQKEIIERERTVSFFFGTRIII